MTREPGGPRGVCRARKIAAMPHSSDSSDSSFSRSPPPGKQVESPLPLQPTFSFSGGGALGARATGPRPGSPRRSEEVAGGRSALSQDEVFAAKPHLLAKTLLLHPSHPSPFPPPLLAGPAPLPLPCAPTPWSFLGSQEENAHQGTLVSRKGSPREAPR